MTTDRTYGAQPGEAGVSVIEVGSQAQSVPSPYGSTLFMGDFRRGPVPAEGVRSIVKCPSKATALRRMGPKHRESQAAIAVEDFFKTAEEAGGNLWCLRVLDGYQRKAAAYIYDRNTVKGWSSYYPVQRTVAKSFKIEGYDPGTYHGKFRRYGGKVAVVSSAISGAVFTTEIAKGAATFSVDELKGGLFYLEGYSTPFTISANADGASYHEITMTQSMANVDTATVTDGRYRIYLDNTDEFGNTEGISVMVNDAVIEPNTRFTMEVFEGKSSVKRLDELSLDDEDKNHYSSVIAQDGDNYEVSVTNHFAGDADADKYKPANILVTPILATTPASPITTITCKIWEYEVGGAATVALLEDKFYLAYSDFTAGSGTMIPHKYVCTVLAGLTTFSVVCTGIEGNETGSGDKTLAGSLPNGTIGSAYAAPHPFLSGFKATKGVTGPAENDTFTIYCRPLGATNSLMGRYYYPYATYTDSISIDPAQATYGLVTTKYRIITNTYNTFTIDSSQDLYNKVNFGGPATVTGTKDETFDLSGGGKTFIFTPTVCGSSLGTKTLTCSLSGAAQTASEVAADLVTQLGTAKLDQTFTFEAVGKNVKIKSLAYGEGWSFLIGAGTLNTILGYTETTYTGTNVTIGRIAAPTEMYCGRDGNKQLTDSHYLSLLDPVGSPINDIDAENTGALLIAIPGVTTAAVQNQLAVYCDSKGYECIQEFPSNTASDQAAVTWRKANLVPKGREFMTFPSYGIRAEHPFGDKTEFTSTLTGLTAGIMARIAYRYEGYHKVPANVEASYVPTIKRIMTDGARGEVVHLNNRMLNQAGIVEVRHDAANIFMFGARAIDANNNLIWWHKLRCKSHLRRELQINSTSMVFEIIEKKLYSRAYSIAKQILEPKFNARGGSWFKGKAFHEAIAIKVDDELNTDAITDQGMFYIEITIVGIANTTERVVYRIGEGIVSQS